MGRERAQEGPGQGRVLDPAVKEGQVLQKGLGGVAVGGDEEQWPARGGRQAGEDIGPRHRGKTEEVYLPFLPVQGRGHFLPPDAGETDLVHL